MAKRRPKEAPVAGPRELLRYDFRDRHEYGLHAWRWRDCPAQHRFVPGPDQNTVRMNWTLPGPSIRQATVVLDSTDGGETWKPVDGWHPPQDRGIYELGPLRMALNRAGLDAWVSHDHGLHWTDRKSVV